LEIVTGEGVDFEEEREEKILPKGRSIMKKMPRLCREKRTIFTF
jgi:hypothetical protein